VYCSGLAGAVVPVPAKTPLPDKAQYILRGHNYLADQEQAQPSQSQTDLQKALRIMSYIFEALMPAVIT